MQLVVSDQATADALMTFFLQERVGAAVAFLEPEQSIDPHTGQMVVRVDVGYNSRASADQLADAAQQRWTTGPLRNQILIGSFVVVHDCRHDEGQGDCSGGNVVVRRKT